VQPAEELFQARFNLSYFFLINIERAAAAGAGDTPLLLSAKPTQHRPTAFPQTESHTETHTKHKEDKS